MAVSIIDAGDRPPGPAARAGAVLPRSVFRAVLALGLAALLVFLVEAIVRFSVPGSAMFVASKAGITTVCLFLGAALLFDALFGRRHAGWLIVGPAMVLLAAVAGQKANYLGDPLYPSDFLYSRQIVELLPLLVRERPAMALVIVAALVAGVGGLAFASRHAASRLPRLGWTGRGARVALVLPAIAALAMMMDYSTFSWTRDRLGILPMMWDQKENYAHNGFALAFALNAPMANVKAPAGYSQAAIEAASPPPGASAALPFERPDIVMVMSESFWDPALLPGVTLSPDPLAATRKVRSGSVHSPEFGGMTANAEFEALTGFSNAFLPYGSIPYQQYVRGEVPSLASFLRDEGYATLAVHPFAGWFWNRAHVYEAFGFETFLAEESLPGLAKRGPLASDEALTEEIIARVEATEEPAFLFAVSLQGHGPYEPNRYEGARIEVEAGVSEWARGSIGTYAEGIADADRGLARLIEWAGSRERPTIVVFFGDHLPPLGPVYVETGFMPTLVAPRKGDAGFMAKVRETPLVIWSNRDGTVGDLGSISPALLPYYLLGAAGIDHPYYTGFLGTVAERHRVIDRHMLVDAGGAVVQDWQQRLPVDPLLDDYRLVQYDLLFGKGYGRARFFPPAIPDDLGPPLASGPAREIRPAPAPRDRVFPPA